MAYPPQVEWTVSSMATLELKYSADQRHQVEAVEAITDLFRGQEFLRSEFTADAGRSGQLGFEALTVGHANGLRLSAKQLLENLHDIQEENSLPATAVMNDGRLRDYTIEMEMGTGKTYVYTRTIFELNKRYGITKFLIVVPSVAIREGVLKSFQSTKKHFATLYNNAPMDVFVYDSKDMGPVAIPGAFPKKVLPMAEHPIVAPQSNHMGAAHCRPSASKVVRRVALHARDARPRGHLLRGPRAERRLAGRPLGRGRRRHRGQVAAHRGREDQPHRRGGRGGQLLRVVPRALPGLRLAGLGPRRRRGRHVWPLQARRGHRRAGAAAGPGAPRL